MVATMLTCQELFTPPTAIGIVFTLLPENLITRPDSPSGISISPPVKQVLTAASQLGLDEGSEGSGLAVEIEGYVILQKCASGPDGSTSQGICVGRIEGAQPPRNSNGASIESIPDDRLDKHFPDATPPISTRKARPLPR